MRQSWSNLELIKLEDGMPCGISLGFDFCAEHEMGTEGINHALELGHAGKTGLARFLAKPIDESNLRLALYERTKATKTIAAETRLVFHLRPEVAQDLASPKCTRRGLPAAWIEDGACDKPLKASWGKDGFCIRAFGDEERDMVRKLHDAARAGDLLVSSAGSANPFSRGGLCLTILSMIPQSVHDAVAEQEAEQKRLEAAVAKTKIEKTLTKAGLRWYALKPSWSDGFKSVKRPISAQDDDAAVAPKTKHPVMFFLNPMEQHKYNHGWFTVEELQDWAKGAGPIMKTAA